MALRTITLDLAYESDTGLVEGVVTADNRDMIRWDLTRRRTNWPPAQDAPQLWATFLAWAALKRQGRLDAEFEEFTERCLTAQVRREAVDVDPTGQATASGS